MTEGAERKRARERERESDVGLGVGVGVGVDDGVGGGGGDAGGGGGTAIPRGGKAGRDRHGLARANVLHAIHTQRKQWVYGGRRPPRGPDLRSRAKSVGWEGAQSTPQSIYCVTA